MTHRYYGGMPDADRQTTSPNRQTLPAWRILAREHPRGTRLPVHAHRMGQLVFAVSGVMRVDTPGSQWTVPPQRALWLPPLHPHAIDMLSDTSLRTVYIAPALINRCGGFEGRRAVHAVVASPLVKALVLGLFDTHRSAEMQGLSARLLLHALGEAACLPTRLAMPEDSRLRAGLEAVLRGQRWDLSMSGIAGAASMSERSFTRRFTQEVGISFRAWRTQARIIASLDLLAAGQPVKSVAHALGFSSAAAYVAAFKSLMGDTPAVFNRPQGLE